MRPQVFAILAIAAAILFAGCFGSGQPVPAGEEPASPDAIGNDSQANDSDSGGNGAQAGNASPDGGQPVPPCGSDCKGMCRTVALPNCILECTALGNSACASKPYPACVNKCSAELPGFACTEACSYQVEPDKCKGSMLSQCRSYCESKIELGCVVKCPQC